MTRAARLTVSFAVAVAASAGAEPAAFAQPHVPLPPVNLGGTSFVDGIAFPGALLELYLLGRNAPSAVTTGSAVAHVALLLPSKFLGGYVGGEVLFSFVHVAVDAGDRRLTGTGFGDLVVSPFVLQWPAIMSSSSGRPLFFQRAAAMVNLPTGAYSRDAPVSVGSNIISFNPYYAFTWFVTEALETSFRFHYLFNSANGDPPARYGDVGSIQPGQAFHFNGAVSYQLAPAIRLGLAGYYLQQFSDARIGGRYIDSRERVAALGPGVRLAFGTLFSIRLNAYREFAAENRPDATSVAIVFSDIVPWPAPPKEPAKEATDAR